MSDEQQAPQFEMSSGNVFADLGFPEPDIELMKAKLVHDISEVVQERKLTQTQAAVLMGLKQPNVSLLLRGKTAEYSVSRLITLLNRIGRDVIIATQEKPATRRYGRTFIGRVEGKVLKVMEALPSGHRVAAAKRREALGRVDRGSSRFAAKKRSAKQKGTLVRAVTARAARPAAEGRRSAGGTKLKGTKKGSSTAKR